MRLVDSRTTILHRIRSPWKSVPHEDLTVAALTYPTGLLAGLTQYPLAEESTLGQLSLLPQPIFTPNGRCSAHQWVLICVDEYLFCKNMFIDSILYRADLVRTETLRRLSQSPSFQDQERSTWSYQTMNHYCY